MSDQISSGSMDNGDSTGKRIARAREAKGLSQEDLAAAIGQKQQTVSAMENNDGPQRPRKLREISRLLGVTEAYLLMETDDPRSSRATTPSATYPEDPGEDDRQPDDNVIPFSAASGAKRKTIPQIDAEAGAGNGKVGEVIQIASGGIMSGHRVVDEWLIPRAILGHSPDGVIALPVVGTSMVPSLGPGDVVFVDTHSSGIRSGEIYVIDEGDGPMVKRLILNRNSDPVTLDIISENAAVGTITRPAETIRVIGRVIGRYQKM